jgi:CubicO group peptidase (beta-lactamase class C family)
MWTNPTLRCLTAVAALAVTAAACSTDPDRPTAAATSPTAADSPAGSAPTSSPTPAPGGCDPDLDAAFGAWAGAGFSGSIAISTGGQADCLAAYGPADEAAGRPNTVDTVFSIGSVSKAFTAAAILALVDDGRLALDERAGDVLPDLAGPVADATVGQLLLHTSGVTGSHGHDHEPLDRDAAVAAISELEQAFPPGSAFLYSNAGYTLLALVVEQVAGTGYRQFVASRILVLPDGDVAGGFWDGEPAAPGDRAVGYLDDGPTDEMGGFAGPHWAVDGNGELAMTPWALARWTHALFTGRILSPEAVAVLTSTVFDLGDGVSEVPGWVAFDASVFGVPLYSAAGGGGDVGHDVVVAWVPEQERVVVMASNTHDVTAEELLAAVGPALLADEPLPRPEVAPASVDPDVLAAAAGGYALDTGGSFTVTADADGLVVAAEGADAVAALLPPRRATAAEVATHEDLVLDLLAGGSQEGREERAALEADLGAIDAVAIAGTIEDDGELRTYVTVTGVAGSMRLWYALNPSGGIAAAEGPADPPGLVVVPTDDGGFRPDDPTGTGPDVIVRFEDGALRVEGPGATAVARRTP